jgi:hypothetical protein
MIDKVITFDYAICFVQLAMIQNKNWVPDSLIKAPGCLVLEAIRE